MHHRGPTDLGRAEAGPTCSGKSAASPASSASLAGSTSMPDDSASSALRGPANHTPRKNRRSIGTLAVAQGRPEEARGLLDEGLKLSLAAHSTRSVTLCLAASPAAGRRTAPGVLRAGAERQTMSRPRPSANLT
jgi:hypothetical protein